MRAAGGTVSLPVFVAVAAVDFDQPAARLRAPAAPIGAAGITRSLLPSMDPCSRPSKLTAIRA